MVGPVLVKLHETWNDLDPADVAGDDNDESVSKQAVKNVVKLLGGYLFMIILFNNVFQLEPL
jgi:adenosine/AMP kinase